MYAEKMKRTIRTVEGYFHGADDAITAEYSSEANTKSTMSASGR